MPPHNYGYGDETLINEINLHLIDCDCGGKRKVAAQLKPDKFLVMCRKCEETTTLYRERFKSKKK